MIQKILIANRGEIAVRIIRTCREMGIETIAVYSEVDKDSLHVRLADEAYCIGKSRSEESYLRFYQIVSLALKHGAQAIHPGYGFLSENEEFAALCSSMKVIFIGPSASAIAKMGDKAVARRTMSDAGVQVPQGSNGAVDSLKKAISIARQVGYPLLLKPSAGGGGKGMRVVRSEEELKQALPSARAEAQSAFGCGDVYLEQFLENGRHIEIQILADSKGNAIHLGERECSVQRRHQKLIEEAPSAALNNSLRRKMGAAAVKAAKAVKYSGAGTVEFLLTDSGEYYFIEMNTRIQVEHPVTEMVTGIDLVREQIRIAEGNKLPFRQRDIHFNGHAIECRINAEDSRRRFLPSPGKIKGLCVPGGVGVRVDSHIYAGYHMPHFYDSLLAKLIVHAPNRGAAIERMKRALREYDIVGLHTTIPFQLDILDHPSFVLGQYTTKLVEDMHEGQNQ